MAKFKTWLATTTFHDSEKSPQGSCMNIAFTATGLKQLVDKSKISKEAGFDQAFLEGMDTDNRNRILGDTDHNAPENWNWGNRKDTNTHGVLMIYAADDALLEKAYATAAEKFAGALSLSGKLVKSIRLNADKEHFGFTDGISQPVLNGLARSSGEHNFINPGEIILGHYNAYDKKPLSPMIDNINFGINGSYMVLRDMQQDVKAFWKKILSDGGDPLKIASKMVGRWPNGIPLVMADTEAEAIKLKQEKAKLNTGDLTAFLNDFEYYDNDKDGLKCPIGAHIRRGNPKDSKNENPKLPNEVSNKHRILRRGKSYGRPLVESMEVKDMIAALDNPDTEERGLNFICFNSDIKRQFEFIQQTWMNNTNFVGLYDEVDPIIGVQHQYDQNTKLVKMMPTKFTEPACPYRHKYDNIPPFVKIRAGGYFFFPGLKAIKFLTK